MKIDSCPYCGNKEALTKFGHIAFETETSLVIVFKDQTHIGRMIVAYKGDHVGEIKDLGPAERAAFMEDVSKTANAISSVYHPDRINYGSYGDTLGHLHFHLCPKYKDQFEWGGTFAMNTGAVASDEEILEVARKIKEAFGG